jgi:hypothetical protein
MSCDAESLSTSYAGLEAAMVVPKKITVVGRTKPDSMSVKRILCCSCGSGDAIGIGLL